MEPCRNPVASILNRELDNRKSFSPGYSLRDFSKELEVSVGHLSEVLRGKHQVSLKTARRLAKSLQLNTEDLHVFELSAKLTHCKDLAEKKVLQARIAKQTVSPNYSEMDLDIFHIVSDAMHIGIFEYLKTLSVEVSTSKIVEAFARSELEVEGCLRRLRTAKLIARTAKGWKAISESISCSSPIPSVAIQKYHRSQLKQSAEALAKQALDVREFQSLTLPLCIEDIPQAKKMISDFLRDFDARFSQNRSPKRRIYTINLQMFGLSNNIN